MCCAREKRRSIYPDSMSITSNSTTSLVSTTTVSSRTPFTRGNVPQKDFQAAFADLQSTYGFGGSGLYYGFGGSALGSIPKQNKSTSRKQKESSLPGCTAPRAPRAPLEGTGDHEAAVAGLQSPPVNVRARRCCLEPRSEPQETGKPIPPIETYALFLLVLCFASQNQSPKSSAADAAHESFVVVTISVSPEP
ncbi:hypothetical protein C8R47DRAFT_1138680 [Mycena vitilis]|nr:hypothetical protein C8R47DRAFT_1138680 [Mycena vitilis]